MPHRTRNRENQKIHHGTGHQKNLNTHQNIHENLHKTQPKNNQPHILRNVLKIISFSALAPSIFLLSYYLVNWLLTLFDWQVPFILHFWLSFQLIFLVFAINGVRDKRKELFFDIFNEHLNDLAKGRFSYSRFQEVRNLIRMDGVWLSFFEDLGDNLQNLAEVERLKQEFISDVSHEIRSPLTSIIGFSQLAQKENIPPEKRAHYLTMIQQQAVRLNDLSTSLLELTDLENLKDTIEKTSFSLTNQLRQTIQALEPQMAEKKIAIQAQLADASYSGNSTLMQQVWQNLLQNAIKFSDANQLIYLSLTTDLTAKTFQVSIRDQGIGMNQREEMQIFDRFYKVDESRSQQGGHGLGLSIVAKILELHGDLTIVVESQKGEGSTFIVSGPLAIETSK